jgi:hypothetical protein
MTPPALPRLITVVLSFVSSKKSGVGRNLARLLFHPSGRAALPAVRLPASEVSVGAQTLGDIVSSQFGVGAAPVNGAAFWRANRCR